MHKAAISAHASPAPASSRSTSAQLDTSGRVPNSEVQTLEAIGPEPALAELRACVQRVVAATPFPCPPDGVSTVEANVCFTAPRATAR